MLTLYRGNRLERLAEKAAGRMDEHTVRGDPVLTSAWVAVEHKGMARWLSCYLAEA